MCVENVKDNSGKVVRDISDYELKYKMRQIMDIQNLPKAVRRNGVANVQKIIYLFSRR